MTLFVFFVSRFTGSCIVGSGEQVLVPRHQGPLTTSPGFSTVRLRNSPSSSEKTIALADLSSCVARTMPSSEARGPGLVDISQVIIEKEAFVFPNDEPERDSCRRPLRQCDLACRRPRKIDQHFRNQFSGRGCA